MADYDYTIAIDFGTTTIAWAIREHGREIAIAISPITNAQVNLKTPSDIHFFLKTENESLSVNNSQLGTHIEKRFKGAEYKVHYHFSFYKMALYENKPGTKEFKNTILYPDNPSLSPTNSNKVFKLSEVYTIVVQHVKKSILQYFTNENKQFEIDRIVWVITVPVIAQQDQKSFMIQCFKAGMGQFNGKYIDDSHIQCVLEPEGGFLYAIHTMKNQLQSKDTNIAIFDFGGDTYDLTVAELQEGQNLKIIISDFGETAGGSDVDKTFMADIETFTNIKKTNISEKDKNIILFNILSEFQTQKHLCLKAGSIEEEFTVKIGEALRHVKTEDVEAAIAKYNENPENPDIELDDEDLIFTMDFAKMRYLYPTKTQLVAKTQKSLEAAKAKGYEIKKCIILGGFSQCDGLIIEIQAQFNLEVLTFPDPSLAIVKGATFYDRFEIKKEAVIEIDKFVKNGIGLETVKQLNELSDLTYVEQKLFQNQYFQKHYVDLGQGICAGGILEVFPVGANITQNLNFVKDFKPTTPQSKEITIILHQFEDGQRVPKLFAHDENIMKSGLNPVKCNPDFSMGFAIAVPMNVAFERRVLTLKFLYQNRGDVIIVYYKWMDDFQFKEQAVFAHKPIEGLDKRFEISKVANVHAVFVIDRSGSMDCPMKLEGAHVHPKNKFKDAVGDVFCGGIYEYLVSRKKELGGSQQSDRYSIILFDDQVDIKCKQKQLQPDDVFDYQEKARGGTDFRAALTGALQAVQGTPADLIPQMIFLTDGCGTSCPLPDDALANQIKGAFKEQIYFLHLGSQETGTKIRKNTNISKRSIKCITTESDNNGKLRTAIPQLSTQNNNQNQNQQIIQEFEQEFDQQTIQKIVQNSTQVCQKIDQLDAKTNQKIDNLNNQVTQKLTKFETLLQQQAEAQQKLFQQFQQITQAVQLLQNTQAQLIQQQKHNLTIDKIFEQHEVQLVQNEKPVFVQCVICQNQTTTICKCGQKICVNCMFKHVQEEMKK